MKHVTTKNRKGVSPVIATILLILIAIAAGVVVYTYAIGFLGSSTSQTDAPQEASVAIDIAWNHTAGAVRVKVRNLGGAQAIVNALYVIDSAGAVVGSNSTSVNIPANSVAAMTSSCTINGGSTYQAKVVSSDGSATSYTFKAS